MPHMSNFNWLVIFLFCFILFLIFFSFNLKKIYMKNV